LDFVEHIGNYCTSGARRFLSDNRSSNRMMITVAVVVRASYEGRPLVEFK
jgi:hypothetical protein